MDNLTKEQRRKNMQNIRSAGTKPERLIMRELKRREIYFASHAEAITGKPDIVFRRKKIAVFIDSDFWHGHPKRCIMPQTNIEYWNSKIARNRKRDKDVNHILKKMAGSLLDYGDMTLKIVLISAFRLFLINLKKKMGRIPTANKKDRKRITNHLTGQGGTLPVNSAFSMV